MMRNYITKTQFSAGRSVVFSFLVCGLLTLGCRLADSPQDAENRPATTEPDRESLKDKEAKKDRSLKLDGFKTYIEKAGLSKEERNSLNWMVSVLTSKDVYEQFVNLCSDNSSKSNMEDCIREARTKLFDVHSMNSARGALLFVKK